MLFLYGELLVLLLVSFAVGSGLAAIALRLLVPQTAPQVEAVPASGPEGPVVEGAR